MVGLPNFICDKLTQRCYIITPRSPDVALNTLHIRLIVGYIPIIVRMTHYIGECLTYIANHIINIDGARSGIHSVFFHTSGYGISTAFEIHILFIEIYSGIIRNLRNGNAFFIQLEVIEGITPNKLRSDTQIIWKICLTPSEPMSIQIRQFTIRRIVIHPISAVLHILEVVWHIVLPFVNHPVDDAFSVRNISPGIFCDIIVQTVPYFPGVEICIHKILIAFARCDIRLLRKSILRKSTNNDVEWVFCAALKSGGGIDFRHIIGDAIQATGNELGIIAQLHQFSIGHIDLLSYSQSDVPFDFPKKYLQCIKCYEFSHNANF